MLTDVIVDAAFATSKYGVELALNHDFFYASVGLHPIHIYDEEFNVDTYQQLIDSSNGRVKAIGECGFDFWHIKATDVPLDDIKKKQKEVFEQHIDLAKMNDLALIVHGRKGKDDLVAWAGEYEV